MGRYKQAMENRMTYIPSWLTRPIKYQLRLIFIRILPILVAIAAPFLNFLKNNKIAKTVYLLSSRKNGDKILLGTHDGLSFLVFTQDNAIGRLTYVHGNFEFDKLIDALNVVKSDLQEYVFLDIGANIGTVAISAIKNKLFNYAICFEPEPNNFNLLCANTYLNGLSDKIKNYNIALSDNRKPLQFELSSDNFGDHRVRLTDEKGKYDEDNRKIIEVKSQTLDHILSETDHLNFFIWMDAQGFEAFICNGATRTLLCRPPMVMEFWPYGMARNNSFALLKKTLSSYGHYVDLADPNFAQNKLANLDNLYNELGEDGRHTDILLLA